MRDAGRLSRDLRALLKERRGLLGLRPRDSSRGGTAPDQTAPRRLMEAAGATDIRDVRGFLSAMRAIKSPEEIALLRKAATATEEAFRAAWRSVRPGATEQSVAAEFVGAAFRAGCERLAFPPIVGSGANAAILHYKRNRSVMRDGDLLLMLSLIHI